MNIDGPAETGIGRTLILLDERRHIPRAIVFILPKMQDGVIDIGRIQGLKDFTLLQGRHDFTRIDIDPDGVAFDDDPPLCIFNDRLGHDQLAIQGYIQ